MTSINSLFLRLHEYIKQYKQKSRLSWKEVLTMKIKDNSEMLSKASKSSLKAAILCSEI